MGGRWSWLVRCMKTSGEANTDTDHTSYDSKQSGMPFIGRLMLVALDKYFDRIETSRFGPIAGYMTYLYCWVGVYLVANLEAYRRNICITGKYRIGLEKTPRLGQCRIIMEFYPLCNMTILVHEASSPRFQHPGMASHSPAFFTTITKSHDSLTGKESNSETPSLHPIL